MSATRDKSQKIGFVYSNLYTLYRKGLDEAKAADVSAATGAVPPAFNPANFTQATAAAPLGLTRGRVLKAETLAEAASAEKPVVEAFRPVEFLHTDRVFVKTPQAILKTENKALESLKQNLEKLNSLHSRLRFMLQELEDLVKE